MVEKTAYSHAAGTGSYDKRSGLSGKYDNVRRLWEDQVTAIFLRTALNGLVERKRNQGEGLRVLDLGCGSGDGFDLVMSVTTPGPALADNRITVMGRDRLAQYVGLDLNPDLLEQARTCYGNDPKLCFASADLSNGLPAEAAHRTPFDLYFTSYGTLSHFHDEQNVKLIADICRHAPDGALFVGDWLGRYAYEWQDLWHHDPGDEYFMDYRISYIYPEEERGSPDIPSFPLRLMTRDEIMSVIEGAAREAGVEIRPRTIFDRSGLVGRHLETGEYNRHALSMRSSVNTLFESSLRTDLGRLRARYAPRPGFDRLNRHFQSFFHSWNTLVNATITLLAGYHPGQGRCRERPEVPADAPTALKRTVEAMRRVIEGTAWLRWGDVRANLIEPQLGFCLRELEMSLEQGMGTGHSIVGIFEIRK